MSRMIYDYTKASIERESKDPNRFNRELNKAEKCLEKEEIESLSKWLSYFASKKEALKPLVEKFLFRVS